MSKSKAIAGYIIIQDHPVLLDKIPFYEGENLISRDPEKADVLIKDLAVSSRHAKLVVSKDQVTITDLGSKNGTFINTLDKQIPPGRQMVITQEMTFFLAEIKCRFERVKQKENLQETLMISKPKIENKKPSKKDVIKMLIEEQDEKQIEEKRSAKIIGNKIQKNEDAKKIVEKQQKNKKNVKEKIQTQKITEIQPNKEQSIPKSSQLPQKDKKQSKKGGKGQTQMADKSEKVEKNEKVQKQNNKKEQKKLSIPKTEPERNQIKQQKKKVHAQIKQIPKDQNIKKMKKKSTEKIKQSKEKEQNNNKNKNNLGIKKQFAETQGEQEDSCQTNEKIKKTKIKLEADKRKRNPQRQSLSIQRNSPYPRRYYDRKKVMISGFVLSFKPCHLIEIVQDLSEVYDVLVMQKFTRTFKVLYSIAKGIPIVQFSWLVESQFAKKIQSFESHYFTGQNHVIYNSIKKVKEGLKVFQKCQFYLLSKDHEYHLKTNQIQLLVYACGGQILKQIPKNKEKASEIIGISALKSNKSDIQLAKKQGISKLYTIQLILNACMMQEINLSENLVE